MSLWLGLDNDLSPPGVTVKSHAEDVVWQLSVVVVTVACKPWCCDDEDSSQSDIKSGPQPGFLVSSVYIPLREGEKENTT